MAEENDKGAGDGNLPLGASNQEEAKVVKKILTISA